MTTINLGKIKPLHKGAYDGGVTYRPLDFTTYFGNLYVCKAASTGNLPTDPAYFDPVASVQAASIPNTPAGSIAATTVQDALNELDSEKVATTAVISIANGGTGATAANAAADAIGAFRRGTLLGTVSQSAGVPTGAVIERGSNASGEYVRFADGTQICTGSDSTTTTTADPDFYGSTSGTSYANTASTGMAATMIDSSYVVVAWATQRGTVALSTPSTNGSLTVQVRHPGIDQAVPYSYIAIGRWY